MKSCLLGAVSACAIAIVSLSAQAASVSGQGTWGDEVRACHKIT